MATLGRRTFLQGAAATTGGVLLGGPLQALIASATGAARPDFRTLGPVADLRDGKVRLHLPPGFKYRSFHDTDGPAVKLHDDTTLPGRHDGMAAFPGPDGNAWLVRNHEILGAGNAFGPGTPYDSKGLSGTTTSLVTPVGEVLDSFTSLNGTIGNCAGGAMPWGSWITCEETVNGPDVFDDFNRGTLPSTTYVVNAQLTKRHGFIFEVPAGGQSNRQPITAAGRFAHEAAAYSPSENAIYLTEDNFAFPSGLYRYLPPNDPMVDGALADGGTLQMLKVVGVDEAHLEAQQTAGTSYAIEWVDIADPAPTFPMASGVPTTTNDAALAYVGNQGRAQGAAHFSRLEGASFTRNEIYFTSTQGGGAAMTGPDTTVGYGRGSGQIWSYDPRSQTLTCRFQSQGGFAFDPPDPVLDLPDNVTARNDRGALVICEDGQTNSTYPQDQYTNYIRGLTRDGTLFDIALNRLHSSSTNAPRYREEFAGSTFSPDGDTLFVNIQASAGITFAIWGPWGRIGV